MNYNVRFHALIWFFYSNHFILGNQSCGHWGRHLHLHCPLHPQTLCHQVGHLFSKETVSIEREFIENVAPEAGMWGSRSRVTIIENVTLDPDPHKWGTVQTPTKCLCVHFLWVMVGSTEKKHYVDNVASPSIRMFSSYQRGLNAQGYKRKSEHVSNMLLFTSHQFFTKTFKHQKSDIFLTFCKLDLVPVILGWKVKPSSDVIGHRLVKLLMWLFYCKIFNIIIIFKGAMWKQN